MKKPSPAFLIAFCLTFFLFSTAQAGEWIKCGRTRHAVEKSAAFRAFNTEVYYLNASQLAIVNSRGKVVTCVDIGPGWQMKGYKKVKSQRGSSRKVILFEIFQGGEFRYFDVANGQEVSIDTNLSLDRDEYSIDEPDPEETEVFIVSGERVRGEKSFPVIEKWVGAQSLIDQEEYYRIMDRQEWKRLWERHVQGNQPVPEINFKDNMVVAIFLGKQINISGVNLLRAKEVKKTLHVDFFPRIYFDGNPMTHSTQPYGIFVIPKNKRQVLFRKNVQSETGGSPKWVVMSQFNTLYERF